MPAKPDKSLEIRRRKDIPALLAAVHRLRKNWNSLSLDPPTMMKVAPLRQFLTEGDEVIQEAERSAEALQTALAAFSSAVPKITAWDKRYWEIVGPATVVTPKIAKPRHVGTQSSFKDREAASRIMKELVEERPIKKLQERRGRKPGVSPVRKSEKKRKA